MASYQEYRPTHFNQYVPDVSAEDFKHVLAAKQQQYDSHYDEVQANIGKALSLQVLRDVDKQYLNSRQDEVIANINKYSNLDLSDNRNSAYLTSNLEPLYNDPKILDAVESTVKIQNFAKNKDDLKKNHPERYSQANEAWDNEALNKYLNSTNPNEKYNGPTSPTLYVDVDKKMQEVYKSLKKSFIGTDANGMDHTGVTADRIYAATLANLSDEDKMQLHINAWSTGALSDNVAKETLNNYSTMLDKIKSQNEQDLKAGKFDKVKQNTENIKKYEKAIEEIKTNPENHLFQGYLSNYVEGLEQANAYDEVEANPYILKRVENQYKVEENNKQREFDKEKYTYQENQANTRAQMVIDGRKEVAEIKLGKTSEWGGKDNLVDFITTPKEGVVNNNAHSVEVIDASGNKIKEEAYLDDVTAENIYRSKADSQGSDKNPIVGVLKIGDKKYIITKKEATAQGIYKDGKLSDVGNISPKMLESFEQVDDEVNNAINTTNKERYSKLPATEDKETSEYDEVVTHATDNKKIPPTPEEYQNLKKLGFTKDQIFNLSLQVQ